MMDEDYTKLWSPALRKWWGKNYTQRFKKPDPPKVLLYQIEDLIKKAPSIRTIEKARPVFSFKSWKELDSIKAYLKTLPWRGGGTAANRTGTTTTVTSSLNPSTSGVSVTFTATVSAIVGSGVPTLGVTFLDGSTQLGTNNLSGGVATFATSSLVQGNHTISANYLGDSLFNPSVGNLNTNPQVVGPASVAAKSLVFTAASSQFLSITGKTNINQQKFTFATWFKRASTGNIQRFYMPWSGSASDFTFISFDNSDHISIFGQVASSTKLNKITNATYTDTVSWHHLCVGVDTTQATAANRVRLYVDGVEVVSWGTNVIPVQNQNLSNNFASTYTLGKDASASADFLDGKLSEIYYIDGQQLTPASFTTGTPLVPSVYSGTYTGVFDFYLNFSNGTSTTTLGLDQSGSGEGNNWTLNNMTVANQSTDHP